MLASLLKLARSSTFVAAIVLGCLKFAADKAGVDLPWEYVATAAAAYGVKEAARRIGDGLATKGNPQ